jgi:hypothetical protein
MARMLASLPEIGQEEFARILEKNDPAAGGGQIQTFISSNFPQFNDWLAEEVGKLKQELADFAGQK